MSGSSVYPNAPLVEAVFEMRFHGEPAVECRRDEYYSLVRAEFPEVLVPHLRSDQPPALSPYYFRNEDKNSTLIIAINRFAYSTRIYERFAKFRERAIKYAKLFGEHFHLESLTRTGLRYTNIIPFNREDGLLPVQRYFRFRVETLPAQPSSVSNISMRYVTPTDRGSLTIRMECVVSSDKREAFLVDFDYAKDRDLAFGEIEKYIDESHEVTKRFFETIVTDEYRRFMQGEVVE